MFLSYHDSLILSFSFFEKVWCDQFSACKILTGDDIGTAAGGGNTQHSETIPEKCGKEATEMSADDHATCRMICDPAACCFHHDARCTRKIDCEYYSFCDKLLLSDSPFNDDTSVEEILPPPGRPHIPGPSPSDVEKACKDVSGKLLPSPNTKIKKSCSQMCENYSCCFEDDYDPVSCHEVSTCEKYSPCKKLKNKDDRFNGVCSVDSLSQKGGFALCEEYCGDHLCCFNGQDCGTTVSQQCSQYRECDIFSTGFIIGTDIHGLTIFDYENACSIDRIKDLKGEAFCSSICEQVSWNRLEMLFEQYQIVTNTHLFVLISLAQMLLG